MNPPQILQGKTIVITGATSGIGLEAALDFSRLGARVIGVGRNSIRCSEAKRQVLEITSDAQISFLLTDLSSQAQIHELAIEIKRVLRHWKQTHLDVLINNAGTYSGRRNLTEDGIERTMAVNHYAPFLLTYLLMPLLTPSSNAKVLTVSSGSHYNTNFDIEHINHPLIYFGLWACCLPRNSTAASLIPTSELMPWIPVW